MLKFEKLDKDYNILKDYFEKSNIQFCDLSVGVRFIWRDDFKVEYAIYNDTLIIKESCRDYDNAFYYPCGKDEEGAIFEIEKYVKENNLDLKFCCIDNFHASYLSGKYYMTEISNDRDWSDYIYDAESFKSFSGKKYSGQRNHINKFKKLYPNATVKIIENADIEKIKEFLTQFESENNLTAWSAISEDKRIREYLDNCFILNQSGLAVYENNKCIGISLGEVVKDTLIVHVEKALKEYEGVYSFLANEYAKAFANDKVKFINREEDCGDQGLRISKLQYHPIEVKEKNIVRVKTLFDNIEKPIEFKTERLTVNDITEKDKEEYFNLYTDEELNKFWGYDYREDLKEKPTKDYFYSFQKKLKEKKEEYSLAIRKENKMIGELVYHNFDFDGGVEIGFRLLRKEQKKGYCFESVSSLIKYAFEILKAKKIKGKCFR
ncbi:MAG: GNAT family N-acetyltransferase, partial [Firmicutes bacterium]|nr:GNAT family N-acetyltransferase [Candidatus Caballimonas caccae]